MYSMKFLERKDIDLEAWDRRIQSDAEENIFCYSWYLDATAENWGGLVSEDYQTILPVPYTVKLGIKRYYQAPFTREYSIFGTNFNWEKALQELNGQFKHFSFRTNELPIHSEKEERRHQFLSLDADLELRYRSNAKRLIKKGNKHYSITVGGKPSTLIQLFKDTVGHKIESIDSDALEKLNQLMLKALNKGKGELLRVTGDNGELLAGGFFLKDKKRITYLKGAATNEAKKKGAMYALFDYAFKKYRPDFDTFDFGGSDVDNVATFYKKFGAADRKYYNYTIDKTPFWFKALRKIKR